jgi:Fe-S cluster assembly ATP-binding protein
MMDRLDNEDALEIAGLRVSVEGKEILKGLDLKIAPGEVHALMGPNGSGKSTLANALLGHPKYQLLDGKIIVDGEEVNGLAADERAKRGLFLSFQHPPEIPGVTVESFLRMAYNSVKGANLGVVEFHTLLKERMDEFRIDPAFARRYLNEGFSGGERKRMEVLQMSILDPKYIILDETDSGLDVDALKIVAQGISRMRDGSQEQGSRNRSASGKHGILIITHFNRILKYVEPDHVHILVGGKIVRSGGKELAHEIESAGYAAHAR